MHIDVWVMQATGMGLDHYYVACMRYAGARHKHVVACVYVRVAYTEGHAQDSGYLVHVISKCVVC